MKANIVWLQALASTLEVKAEASPRGQDTLETIGVQSRVDMTYPIVSVIRRNLSFQFMAAEAYWILTGDDRVESIAPYAPSIAKFSDDGVRFYGAYGPRVSHQLGHLVNKLIDDHYTRQAVLTIWRPNPPESKDIPCTVAVQFILRPYSAGLKQRWKLDCIDTMRSSDLWLGWVYDVFNFSMLSAVVALRLRNWGIPVDLGHITMQAGSRHIYTRNLEGVKACLEEPDDITYAPLDLDHFQSEQELLAHLKAVADQTTLPTPFMKELML